MEGCFCTFSLCISLHLYISVSVGHHGLWRSGCLSVLLSVHQTVWAAVRQCGTVWPVLQSRRLVEMHTLRCLQVSYKVLSNCGVDITLCHPLTFFLSLFVFAGRSADHIVCCLSRDSYGTGIFLQELMSALSLQQQLPAPEPSDQDFYSQFTNTNTGNYTGLQCTSLNTCGLMSELGHLRFKIQFCPALTSLC